MKNNIIFNALSVLIAGLILFLTYKYAILKLGVSQLGVWSLVVAFASFSKIIENGIAVSVLRMTAHVSDSKEKIEDVLMNSIAIGLIGLLVFNFVLCGVINYLAPIFYENEIADSILFLLNPVLIFFWISSLSMILLSLLEGLSKIKLKLIATVFSGSIFLIVITPSIDFYGLKGLVYAQIIQSVSLLCILYMIITFHIEIKFRISYLNLATIRQILIFSRSTQLITFTHLFSEPTTKILLGYFGGSSLVALFDMALKLTNQLRAIVVSTNQVVVPFVTKMYKDYDGEKIKNYYFLNLKFVLYAGFIIYIPLLILTPEISFYWLGVESDNFIMILSTLAVVNLLNILTIPGYYMSISGNLMKWNTLGHIAFCLFNIILGLLFGYIMSGIGVFYGYIFALIIASLLMLYFYNKQFQLHWLIFCNLSGYKSFVIILLFALVTLQFNAEMQDLAGGVNNLMILKFLLIILSLTCFVFKIKFFKESEYVK